MISRIIGSSFTKWLIIAATLLAIALTISFKIIQHKDKEIDRKNEKIKSQEDEKEVLRHDIIIHSFEANQTASINAKKEQPHEEIPDTIGIHTIIFND